MSLGGVSRVWPAMAAVAWAVLVPWPTAGADPLQPPPQFPDIDAYPAVNLNDYAHFGSHPSGSGWLFKTPNGVTCAVSLLDDIGATCWGDAVGPPTQSEVNATSMHAGRYSPRDPNWNPDATVLPVGTKLDNGNGIACAVTAPDSVACRTGPNRGIDTSNPQNSRYGVHGFVLQPGGNWTF
ncbi:hypothetical protein [Mycobacterium bourgelatii]|nr:hypothetical protein [Mycobacterium bourgelatii]MCV6976366.1 hypothetical protein [Mycobacterium bourgelatii]